MSLRLITTFSLQVPLMRIVSDLRSSPRDGVAGGAVYGDGPVLAPVPLPVTVGVGESGGVKCGERERGNDAG
jgi:hypothetical protein